MKGLLWVSALVVAIVVLAGCGGSDGESTVAGPRSVPQTKPKKPLRKMSITLDGYAGPENVGVLTARWEKYFDEDGIELTTYSPTEPSRAVRYTADGTVDVGISREPELVMAQSQGIPLVAIGSLVSEPTAAMIWLGKSKIKGIADLKGKTIGFAGLPMQGELLRSVLAQAGLSLSDVKLKDVGYNAVPTLVKGKVDAIFGAGWNLEGTQLEALGAEPVITRVQDLGIPPYEEFLVVARRDRLKKEPELFSDFMAAVSRGTATAIENPDLAFEVVNEDVESDFRVSPKAREAQVEATLPLLSESGEMDPAQAKRLVDWMHSEGMIKKKPSPSSLLTNRYLPQSGE